MKSFSKYFFLMCLLMNFVILGCKRDSIKYTPTEFVEGVVTLDGQAVEEASVIFTPVDKTTGETATGMSDQNGVYRLTSLTGAPNKGAIQGDYLVSVNKVKIEDKKVPGERPGEPEREITTQTFVLPEKYRYPDKTPITKTVSKGKNQLDIELSK